MALGVAQTAVLCTAAQLGLADQVKDGPKSVEALAEVHQVVKLLDRRIERPRRSERADMQLVNDR
jgi:hypothetical protein